MHIVFALLSQPQAIAMIATIAVLGIGLMAAPMAFYMREYERQGLFTGPYDALRKVFRYRWLSDGISLPQPRYKRVQEDAARGILPTDTVANTIQTPEEAQRDAAPGSTRTA